MLFGDLGVSLNDISQDSSRFWILTAVLKELRKSCAGLNCMTGLSGIVGRCDLFKNSNEIKFVGKVESSHTRRQLCNRFFVSQRDEGVSSLSRVFFIILYLPANKACAISLHCLNTELAMQKLSP